MHYKIFHFLIWFHHFSTLVGKVNVPLLKDVLPEKRTKSQLQPSGLALLILLPGALLQIDLLVRIGEIFSMAASGSLGLNLMYAIRQKPLPNDQLTFFNYYLLLKSYH